MFLPDDPNVPGDQALGKLRIFNATVTGFDPYTLVNGVKVLPVKIKVAGTSGTKTVVIGYGGHLARQQDFGLGKGASSYPGASRKAYANANAGNDANVAINPDAIVPTVDLSVTQSATPAPVAVGSLLTFTTRVQNLSAYSATGVVLNLTPPAGSQITASQGTVSGNSVSLGTLLAGQQATVTVTTTAPCGPTSTTATLTSATPDPVAANDTVTTTVTPVDTVPPLITIPADNISVSTETGKCSAIVTFATSVTDNCSTATLVCLPASGSEFPKGMTTVTCTATDATGNISARSFTVTVNDAEPPILTLPENISVSTDAGQCSAIVNFAANVTDNCPGATFICSPASGTAFDKGITTVNCTATDATGHTTVGSFTVTVTDDENPTLLGCPAQPVIAFAAPITCATAVVLPNITASDSCAGLTTVGTRSDGLDLAADFPIGTTHVTYTAMDAAGNAATPCSYDVIVLPLNLAWPVATRLLFPEPDPTTGVTSVGIDESISAESQSRWYKFRVQPGSKLLVTLDSLPENYDLVLYKDIQQTYDELTQLQSSGDLTQLNAEFAADAFSAAAFSSEAFAGAAFSGAAFSGAAWSGAAWSGAAFSGAAFSGAAWSPDVYAPDTYFGAAFSGAAFSGAAWSGAAFSGAAFSGAAFSGAAFSGAAFSGAAWSGAAWSGAAWSGAAFSGAAFSTEATSGAAWSGAAFSGAAFSDAQMRSIVGVSAFPGVGNEVVLANTWDNARDFYVRVRGRNGVFAPCENYHLGVYMLTGACGNLQSVDELPVSSTQVPVSGSIKTLILADFGRMEQFSGTSAEVDSLKARLASFGARVDIGGAVIDVGLDARVAAANAQADDKSSCPSAKNIVAAAIRELVRRYRDAHPEIEYVVIVGNDAVIPFYRQADQGLLANENNYIPPVLASSASDAVLKLGYFLTQDYYAAACDLSAKVGSLPLPDLGLGRLVETPADINKLLDAYDSLSNGTVVPTTGLVTGYDFLSDSATVIGEEFEKGFGEGGAPVDTLIQPNGETPVNGWSADDLRAKLLNTRHDLIFLGGHFSAVGALAADYQTRMTTAELDASDVDLKNSIVFSVGCHSGYNIVNSDAVPGVTQEPDWAQAFTRKGASLIAGTGYQYGDTDIIEYSERLYVNFARQLHAGTGPVAIGKALALAKALYLAETPAMRGLHEKALLQTTLFGLPMLQVNLPGDRGPLPSDTSVVSDLNPAPQPGQAFGLQFKDLGFQPGLARQTSDLSDVDGGANVTATYFTAGNGVVANPAEPFLPLEIRNVSVGNQVLRGVGFRSATYEEEDSLRPLTSAATTELSGVHTPFLSDTLFPVRFWNVNYFDAVCEKPNPATRLFVIPAQFVSEAPGSEVGTFRKFTNLDFRLYYNNNTTTYVDSDSVGVGGSLATVTPALSGAPSIAKVSDQVSDADPNNKSVKFNVRVFGSPFAGLQEVWVTYTGVKNTPGFYGSWQSLNLTQPDPVNDSSLWEATLPIGAVEPGDLRYMVQAANGLGIVALDTRLGAYYIPGEVQTVPEVVTVLTIDPINPAQASYSTKVTYTATLIRTDSGERLAGQIVNFALGTQEARATTDGNGVVTVTIPMLGVPGSYDLRASYVGNNYFRPSADAAAFTVTADTSSLSLAPTGTIYVQAGVQTPFVATLTSTSNDNGLAERTVFFVFTLQDSSANATGPSYYFPVITDFAGRATFDSVPKGAVPDGIYDFSVYFGSDIPGQPINAGDPRYSPSTTFGQVDFKTTTIVVNDPEAAIQLPEDATINSSSDGLGDCAAAFAPVTTIGSTIASQFVVVIYTVEDVPITTPHSFPVGTTTVTTTVFLGASVARTGSFTVTVLDDEAPTVRTKNITVQLDDNGNASITAADVDNGSSDNCAITSLSVSPGSFTCANVGVANFVTLTVTDSRGNVATGTATVTVEDHVAPNVLTQNITVQLDTAGNASITAAQVNNGSSDNCGIANLSLSQTSFSCAHVGANSVTLTVTDSHGNVATGTATVIVQDSIAPTVLTQNITVQLDAAGNASITAAQVNDGSSDNCAIAGLSVSPSSFSCANVGANTVTLTVTDSHNNSVTGTAVVLVQDILPPTAVCKVATATVDPATGLLTVSVSEIDGGSTDNCAIVSVEISKGTSVTFGDKVTFDNSEAGIQPVTLRVTDASGNRSTCNTSVTVPDIAPPVGTVTSLLSDLGSPNHKMMDINLRVDANDPDQGQLRYRIACVSSDEPLNGTGDGDKSPDWSFDTGPGAILSETFSPDYSVSQCVGSASYGWSVPGQNVLALQLRAERAQNGDGRVYTFRVEIMDPSGNIGFAVGQLFVPKN